VCLPVPRYATASNNAVPLRQTETLLGQLVGRLDGPPQYIKGLQAL